MKSPLDAMDPVSLLKMSREELLELVWNELEYRREKAVNSKLNSIRGSITRSARKYDPHTGRRI